MVRQVVVAAMISIGAASCRHAASPGPEMTDGQFQAEGRILVRGGLRGPSASFDADRVIGPTINMSRQPDGTWTGWIRDQAFMLSVAPGKVSSPTLTMSIQDLPNQGVDISGMWIGRAQVGNQIAIHITPNELYVREPHLHPPVYLAASGPGIYGTGAYADSVEFTGSAALPHPPEPQFALAVLGAF